MKTLAVISSAIVLMCGATAADARGGHGHGGWSGGHGHGGWGGGHGHWNSGHGWGHDGGPGYGIQFAAMAKLVYDLARARGLGRQLPLEWFQQNVNS